MQLNGVGVSAPSGEATDQRATDVLCDTGLASPMVGFAYRGEDRDLITVGSWACDTLQCLTVGAAVLALKGAVLAPQLSGINIRQIGEMIAFYLPG